MPKRVGEHSAKNQITAPGCRPVSFIVVTQGGYHLKPAPRGRGPIMSKIDTYLYFLYVDLSSILPRKCYNLVHRCLFGVHPCHTISVSYSTYP